MTELHSQASEEARKLAADALDESVHPAGCPSNCHQLRVALLLDRVSAQALERAAKVLCEYCALGDVPVRQRDGARWWHPGDEMVHLCSAAAIRGLSDGESVASEEK